MNFTKKVSAIAITAVVLLIGTHANAQSFQKSKLRFGIGIDGLIPVGNLTNVANLGVGITPRLQLGIANNVALTFTTGYYHFFTKKVYVPVFIGSNTLVSYQNDLDIIPVKAGLKAFVSSNIYIGAEIGAGFEVDNGGGNTKLIASPAIGYASKKWEVGARYESFSGQHNNYSLIGVRLAYGFGL
ncbi:hypothetical protein [Mucilaginibacter phyllosphaerae]